jgi:4-amino-4-deoxy-L-arabinose transferase-like glycosyltransferase
VAVGLIAAVALFARLLHVLSYDPVPSGAMSIYVEMAVSRLTIANLFGMEGLCWLPPGYALFLKPFLEILGPAAALPAIRIAQALLGAWTCILIYRLGVRLHSRRAGLAAASLTCFYPHLLFYSSVYLSENLFVPLYLLSLLLLLRSARRPTAGRLYSAGLVAGCTLLVRPVAISLLPAVLLAAGRSDRAGSSRGGRKLTALLFIAGVLTVLAPWSLRNWIAYGRFVPIAPSGAFTLASANHPEARAGLPRPPVPDGSSWTRMEEVRGETWSFARRDPWGLLLGITRDKWQAFWELAPPPPLSTSNPQLLAGEIFLPFISWQSVALLGALGLGSLLARRPGGYWVTPACFALFLLYSLVHVSGSKARLPSEVFFLAWAGIALAEIAARIPRLRKASSRSWSAVIAVLLVLSLGQAGIQGARAREFTAGAASLIARGDQIPVIASGPPVPLFGERPLRVDRARGRYVRLSFDAYRSGPRRHAPGNGMVRITFIDGRGRPLRWLENPASYLEALGADRWSRISFKAHVPPAAVACRVIMTPDPESPDMLILDRPTLRYAMGNDLALEFIFPYLRFKE